MIEQLSAPRVDEREWVRLQEELAYLFAKILGQSRWQYLDTLPIYTPQPVEYQGYDNLVLVQPPQPERGLSLEQILDRVGLSYSRGVLKMRDWRYDKGRFETPVVPYATWLEDGERNLEVALTDVRASLPKNARGGTGLEGIFLYAADRGILRRHFPECPGSAVGPFYAPSLCLEGDRPKFDSRYFSWASPNYGAVVAGRKIVLGKLAV